MCVVDEVARHTGSRQRLKYVVSWYGYSKMHGNAKPPTSTYLSTSITRIGNEYTGGRRIRVGRIPLKPSTPATFMTTEHFSPYNLKLPVRNEHIVTRTQNGQNLRQLTCRRYLLMGLNKSTRYLTQITVTVSEGTPGPSMNRLCMLSVMWGGNYCDASHGGGTNDDMNSSPETITLPSALRKVELGVISETPNKDLKIYIRTKQVTASETPTLHNTAISVSSTGHCSSI